MFSIVKFKCDGSVQVVSSNWLTDDKKFCYWPPGPNSNPTRKIKKHENPSQNWQKLNVKFWKNTNDYIEARNLENEARSTDDLDTTDSEFLETLRSREGSTNSAALSDDNSSDKGPHIFTNNTRPISGAESSTDSRKVLLIDGEAYQLDVIDNTTTVVNQPNSVHPSCSFVPSSYPEELAESATKSIENALNKILLRQLALERVVGEGFSSIKEDIRINLGHLGGQTADPKVLLPVDIPLGSASDLTVLNSWLDDEDNFKKLELIFAAIGGARPQKIVSGILKRALSKEFASKTNWNGQHNRIKFDGTNLCKVIIASSRRGKTGGEATVPEIVKHIQHWLSNQRDNKQWDNVQKIVLIPSQSGSVDSFCCIPMLNVKD